MARARREVACDACVGNSCPDASAISPSSTPRRRQSQLKVASSLGQPQPIGRYVLAGWPYRPCFQHSAVPLLAAQMTLTMAVVSSSAARRLSPASSSDQPSRSSTCMALGLGSNLTLALALT